MNLIRFLAAILALLDSTHGRDAGETIRLGLNEPTDKGAAPDSPDTVPVTAEKASATWPVIGGALIFFGLLIYPADVAKHGFQANPWVTLASIAIGIGVCFRLRLAVLIVAAGFVAMLFEQGQVVLSWAAQAGSGALMGLVVSTLMLILFGALCFWFIRTAYRQWDTLR